MSKISAKYVGIKWIDGKAPHGLSVGALLRLYEIYQTRQMCDLDMHFRFANYYTVALTALFSVFVVGISTVHNQPWAGLLSLVPLLSILLIHQGKLTTYRFYRRYTEGRVRLTKIEYLLGLCGRIPVRADLLPPNSKLDEQLWAEDPSFLPHRYFEQSIPYSTSSEFVLKRGWNYGLGILTQRTFSVFYIFSWFLLIILPLVLCALCAEQVGDADKSSPVLNDKEKQIKIIISCGASAVAILVALGSTARYLFLRTHMIGETPAEA